MADKREARAKRPRGSLHYRFMCIRCGGIIQSDDPNDLVEKMRCHYFDLEKSSNSGCCRVEQRHKNCVIAHYDHRLGDALWHCQKQLHRLQWEATNHRNAAEAKQRVEIEKLTARLAAAEKTVGELGAAKELAERQLQEARAKPASSAVDGTLAAIARSSMSRKRKLTAFLHPDGLPPMLADEAKLAREALGL